MSIVIVLMWLIVLLAVAWVAHYIIATYFPADVRTPALFIVGLLLLLVLVYLILGWLNIDLRVPIR